MKPPPRATGSVGAVHFRFAVDPTSSAVSWRRSAPKKRLEDERPDARIAAGSRVVEGSSRAAPAEPEQARPPGRLDAAAPGGVRCRHRSDRRRGTHQRIQSAISGRRTVSGAVAEVRGCSAAAKSAEIHNRPALSRAAAGMSSIAFGPRLPTRMSKCWPGCTRSHARRSSSCSASAADRAGPEFMPSIECSGASATCCTTIARPARKRSSSAEAVHADRTTWLSKADPCWLSKASTAALVCYQIDPRRTQQSSKKTVDPGLQQVGHLRPLHRLSLTRAFCDSSCTRRTPCAS